MSALSKNEVLIAVAIGAWKSALQRANTFFTGLDDEGLQAEIAPGRNRPIYLWGHLTAMHDRMLQLLGAGARIHPELDEVFLSSPDNKSVLPSVEVIRSRWTKVNTTLNTAIDGFSTSDWLAKHTAVSDEDFAKDPLRNRFAILLSRTNHLSHHLGQTTLAHK